MNRSSIPVRVPRATNIHYWPGLIRQFIKSEIAANGVVAVRDLVPAFGLRYRHPVSDLAVRQQMQALERDRIVVRLGQGAYGFAGVSVPSAEVLRRASPGRARVLDLLISRERVMASSEIARVLGITATAASTHLAKLRREGLIRRARHPSLGTAGYAAVAAVKPAAPVDIFS